MADTDSVKESLRIKADTDAVWNTVGDFPSYPEWLAEFKESEVLATREDGWAEQVRFTLGAVGITICMTLAYTYTDDRMTWTLVEGDMLQRLDGGYTIADNGDGTTTLTYELEVVSTVPLPGMVRRRIATKVVKDSLKAIRARAEKA